MRPQIFLIFLFVLLFSACGDEGSERDIRDYYFPLKQLQTGQVYEYHVQGADTIAPDRWYYFSIANDSTFYFTKVLYGKNFQQEQLIREQVVNNGLLVNTIFQYSYDSVGIAQSTKGEIISPNAFPFLVEDSTYVQYDVRFATPTGSQRVQFQRAFAGDTTYTIQGEEYPAVVFRLNGTVDVRDRVEGDIEPPFWGEEIYAKGIGLVAYRRWFSPEGGGLQYILQDRYALEELEAKAKAVLQ